MKKVKVLQIIDTLSAGGAEVLAVNIANELAKRGVESFLCVTRNEGVLKKTIDRKVGYLFLERKHSIDFFALLKLKFFVKKNQINIIHAHSTSSFIAFCLKMIYPKVNIIWHDHYGKGEQINSRKSSLLSFFSYFFSSIIVVNVILENWALRNLKFKNVFLLNNFAAFQNLEKKTKLLGYNNKRIVHVAGFREQKDHLNLLKSFNLVKEKHPDWSLHLIGKDYNNDYSKSIIEFIKDNKLEEHVFLYGVCSDIKNILNQATIGVLSSKSEGLPVSLLEYCLAKLPVLVTDVGDCKNVVTLDTGIVVSGNSDKFGKKLQFLVENKKERILLLESINKNFEENYSLNKFFLKLEKIYDKC